MAAKAPKDTLSEGLAKLARRFGDRVAAALYRRAEVVMADSKANYVPVDLGPLKNSGKVFPPERSGRRISVALAFGDAASAYALAVHEHPSDYSPPSWMKNPGAVTFSPSGHGPKYLEKPLFAHAATMAVDLAADLQMNRL